MLKSLILERPLIEARIRTRLNRFVMVVEVDGKEHEAHCPATGKIWNIDFTACNLPCLVSPAVVAAGSKRRTAFTVEAISLTPVTEPASSRAWIGINQNKANHYVEHFLRSGSLPFASATDTVRREVKVGRSRLDFQIGDHSFLEVKTPLMLHYDQPIPPHVKLLPPPKTARRVAGDRMVRHFEELTAVLAATASQPPLSSAETTDAPGTAMRGKAYCCLVHMYDAATFQSPPDADPVISKAVRDGLRAGMEWWQINLLIDQTHVRLSKCFSLDLGIHLSPSS